MKSLSVKHNTKGNRKNKYMSDWKEKEGVFETPDNRFIIRALVKREGGASRKTISIHDTKEEAEIALIEFNKQNQ